MAGNAGDVIDAAGLEAWQIPEYPQGHATRRAGHGPSRETAALRAVFARAEETRMEAENLQRAVLRGRRIRETSERWWLEASILYADAGGDVAASELRARRTQKAAVRTPFVADADSYDPKDFLKDANREVISLRSSRHELGACVALSGPAAGAALLTACNEGDLQLLERLMRRNDSAHLLCYVESCCQKSALHLAAERGHLGICSRLCDHGVDVHAPDKLGRTPLALACMHAKRLVAQQLMLADAEPCRFDQSDRNALHVACCCSDPEVPLLLLNHDNRLINVQDGRGRSCLWYSLSSTHGKMRHKLMKQLLKRRADTNLVDFHGRAPLWYASQMGLSSLVDLLLQHTADPSRQDEDGLSPIDVARGVMTGACLDVNFSYEDEAKISQDDLIHAEALTQVCGELAKREQTIQGLRARLEATTVMSIDVTGLWSCTGSTTVIALRQDTVNGEVVGQISTPGQPALAFDGKVIEDMLIYTTGPRREPTTFRLRLDNDPQLLKGHWEDFRGGSGQVEMRAIEPQHIPTYRNMGAPIFL